MELTPTKNMRYCVSYWISPVILTYTQGGVLAFEMAELRNFTDLAKRLNPQQVECTTHVETVFTIVLFH